ncbi:hypothetical protein [Streptomyces viridochromogenes]|uniref:Putative ATP/GTP-binding protein n=1 Tax=Streptomyces viridochromogenes Tue57 TaxID=1160705 RepID=L8PNZ0_STRVR|nr:hypothetical protein [Streptomyces viridochromogenes]ELS57753.1 putative ATP/GTP-binding protein [Streptomyces viridochromogenes Tue57]
MLFTSRHPMGPEPVSHLTVGGLTRQESLVLLHSQAQQLSTRDAELLAHALDGLPKALIEAAEALENMPTDAYLALLTHKGAESPLAPADRLTAQLIRHNAVRLRGDDPQAANLLDACTLLAPEPFPLHSLAKSAFAPPGAHVLTDQDNRERVLSALSRQLARVSDDGLQLHRLARVTLRGALSPAEHSRAAQYASHLLAAASPGNASDPHTWPRWTGVLPHLLFIAPMDLTSAGARLVALEACRYLSEHGEPHRALVRLEELHSAWADHLGPDHQHRLWAGAHRGRVCAEAGDAAGAKRLLTEVYSRQRRVLGEGHPDTLSTAVLLAPPDQQPSQ